MSKTLLLFFGLLPFVSIGQQKTFYDKAHEKVDSIAGYYYAETLERQLGGWVYVRQYFPNNNLKFEGAYSTYREADEKNIAEGLHQYFRKDSTVCWFTENYANGKLQGESRTYYPGGQLRRIELFDTDTLVRGTCFKEDGTPQEFTPSQQAPIYPGGEKALYQHFSDSLQYPKDAYDRGIEGTALISFVVNKDGHVSDVIILKDPGGGCGLEAVRLAKSMARWNPGFAHDEPVKVRYTMPLKFKLVYDQKKRRKKH